MCQQTHYLAIQSWDGMRNNDSVSLNHPITSNKITCNSHIWCKGVILLKIQPTSFIAWL